jgi:hypothetical protein
VGVATKYLGYICYVYLALDMVFLDDIYLSMEESVNPYSAPRATEEPPALVGVYASGKYVVVEKMGFFPEYCFLTGEKVADEKRCFKKLHFLNPFWALLFFLYVPGWIIYAIISLSCTKQIRVTYSLSVKSRKKLYKKRLFCAIACLPILAAAIFLFLSDDRELVGYGFVAVVVFVIALIISIIICSVMRVRKYKNGLFYITGSCKEFRDQLKQFEPMG